MLRLKLNHVSKRGHSWWHIVLTQMVLTILLYSVSFIHHHIPCGIRVLSVGIVPQQTPWWRHQMETFSFYWPFVRGIDRSTVNSPHKGQWRGALMFSLICAWINGWVNNGEAGDLRHHRAHYGVSVMWTISMGHIPWQLSLGLLSGYPTM